MTDHIKEDTKEKLPDLKPGHKRLDPGVKVFHGARVHKEQVPEVLVTPQKEPGAAPPGKVATSTPKGTGSPQASGLATKEDK